MENREGLSEFRVETDEPRNGITVVSVSGELDLATASQLRAPLLAAVNQRPDSRVAVDLTNCAFIDSQGIATLLEAYRILAGEGPSEQTERLVVAAESEGVVRTLELTGIGRWIPLVRDRESAVQRLAGSGS
jgi:anti-anti-sigma factor